MFDDSDSYYYKDNDYRITHRSGVLEYVYLLKMGNAINPPKITPPQNNSHWKESLK